MADIAAIRQAIGPDVPIMGIFKVKQPDGSLFITPERRGARTVIAAGAGLVALDGTPRPRPGGESLREVVAAIHAAGGAALADVGTFEDARYAVDCGVDAVGTTLSGYTPDSPQAGGSGLRAAGATGRATARSGLCRGADLDAGGGAAGARTRRVVRRRRDGDHQPDRDHRALRRGHCAIAV